MYALDLARFIAMLLMVQGHVLDAVLPDTVTHADTLFWDVWNWIRGLTAPVFLLVSGASHVFAAKRGADGFIRRDIIQRRIRMGVMLIGIGYLLVLPGRRLIDLPYVTTDGWYQVLGVNILQLIGVTLIAFVMVMEKSTSTADMRRRSLITIAVILALSPVMHMQAIHEHLPMWLRPYLTMKYGSLFPLFPISAYLFVGAILGTYLSELPEEQRGRWLMRSGFRIALPIALVMYGIQQYLMARGVHWHYLSSSNSEFLVLARSAVAMVCIGVSVLLLRITWPLRNTYVLFGKKGLYIYVLHIVVLFGTPWWDGVARGELKSMTISSALTTLAIVLGSTLAITYGVYRYEQAAISVSTRQTIRRVLLGALMIQLALGL
jgi:uncharacterized membrane protein